MALDRVLHGGQTPRTVAEVEAERAEKIRAAAPELLAALQRAISSHWLSIDFDRNRTSEACDVRRIMIAAIAKATAPCLALLMLFSLATLNGCVALDGGLIILSTVIDNADAAQKGKTP